MTGKWAPDILITVIQLWTCGWKWKTVFVRQNKVHPETWYKPSKFVKEAELMIILLCTDTMFSFVDGYPCFKQTCSSLLEGSPLLNTAHKISDLSVLYSRTAHCDFYQDTSYSEIEHAFRIHWAEVQLCLVHGSYYQFLLYSVCWDLWTDLTSVKLQTVESHTLTGTYVLAGPICFLSVVR
jgi:hypothetical protein